MKKHVVFLCVVLLSHLCLYGCATKNEDAGLVPSLEEKATTPEPTLTPTPTPTPTPTTTPTPTPEPKPTDSEELSKYYKKSLEKVLRDNTSIRYIQTEMIAANNKSYSTFLYSVSPGWTFDNEDSYNDWYVTKDGDVYVNLSEGTSYLSEYVYIMHVD